MRLRFIKINFQWLILTRIERVCPLTTPTSTSLTKSLLFVALTSNDLVFSSKLSRIQTSRRAHHGRPQAGIGKGGNWKSVRVCSTLWVININGTIKIFIHFNDQYCRSSYATSAAQHSLSRLCLISALVFEHCLIIIRNVIGHKRTLLLLAWYINKYPAVGRPLSSKQYTHP